jgi:hypothetical protein
MCDSGVSSDDLDRLSLLKADAPSDRLCANSSGAQRKIRALTTDVLESRLTRTALATSRRNTGVSGGVTYPYPTSIKVIINKIVVQKSEQRRGQNEAKKQSGDREETINTQVKESGQ